MSIRRIVKSVMDETSKLEDVLKLARGETAEEDELKPSKGKTAEEEEKHADDKFHKEVNEPATDHQASATRPSSHPLSSLIDRIKSNRNKAVSACDLAYISIRNLKCSISYSKTDVIKCKVVIVKAKHSLLNYPNLLTFVGTGENETSAKIHAFENLLESLEKICLNS